MARDPDVHNCSDPDCWKNGKSPITFEIPVELEEVLKQKAKRYGVSYEQFAAIVLEDYFIKKRQLEEIIETTVKKAFNEEHEMIAAPLELELKKMRDLNRILLELFSQVKEKLRKKNNN